MRAREVLLAAIALCGVVGAAVAQTPAPQETPFFAEAVTAGKLPPVASRLPGVPRVVDLPGMKRETGTQGGTWRMLMSDQRDLRMMTVYSYARLVTFDETLHVVPDILESVEIKDDKVFTLHLREGHRWSDGEPFTAEDFRYWWEDVANNTKLSPSGPNAALLVRGKGPTFDIVDPLTVRYSWDDPNPAFLPALAGAQPVYIFMPSHYLRQFHQKYASKDKLEAAVKKAHVANWGSLHDRMSRQYRPENPDLPTLEPWRNTTAPPAEQFTFERNPYFHRIDQAGRQLPYIDRVTLSLSTPSLIPAKTASGDSSLQARYLSFEDYTFLKQNEEMNSYAVRLWESSQGSYAALMPNLNAADPVWRGVVRDVRFRRALSLGINRHDINQALFFGLARESGNTVLPQSPLFETRYATSWCDFDLDQANRLLDEAGLAKRGADGMRLLPDGRRADIVVETAGDNNDLVDIMELVGDDYAKLGLRTFVHPSQRDVFRQHIADGRTVFSMGPGLDNGAPTPAIAPDALAPLTDAQFQWPRWGLFAQSGGHEGDRIDMPEVQELDDLYRQWRRSGGPDERKEIWAKMLWINADQVFTVGIINGTKQPVVVSNHLRNVPNDALYGFEPGGFFGIYMPDTFFFDNVARG